MNPTIILNWERHAGFKGYLKLRGGNGCSLSRECPRTVSYLATSQVYFWPAICETRSFAQALESHYVQNACEPPWKPATCRVIGESTPAPRMYQQLPQGQSCINLANCFFPQALEVTSQVWGEGGGGMKAVYLDANWVRLNDRNTLDRRVGKTIRHYEKAYHGIVSLNSTWWLRGQVSASA